MRRYQLSDGTSMRRWIGERVARGESLVGTFVSTPSLATSEVLAACGFDVLVADAEHSPLSSADVQTIIAGADLGGVPALVRLSDDSATSIQYALDAGAAGVIVPRVHTAAQTAAVVAAATYPPRGVRGAGGGRASLYGLDRPVSMEEALAETLIAVQIESAEAVANLDAILAVEHLSMVFVGPNDLWHSLGRPPEEELRRVIDDVLVRAHAAGVRTGILASTPELVDRYRRAGVSLLLTGTDVALLADGARALIAALAPRDAPPDHQSIDR
ncbi:MAG: 4-hydroxy-2-oxoheptanedioate aldolase [Gaiellales bacterium]|jgi:4-hydroxy-2-oxoheptanedioate aldolase|nr:4-hydroxy-2-oxoheptanedioate aldolase [Gaiellales bacterium]